MLYPLSYEGGRPTLPSRPRPVRSTQPAPLHVRNTELRCTPWIPPPLLPRTSRRIRAVLATLVLAGTGVVASTEASAADPARPAPASIDAAFVALAPTASTQANVALYVNSHRRSRGLSALGTSGALTNAAQLQANYMASTGRMTHTGAGGTTVGTRVTRAGYRWSMVGENIAYGQPSSSAVVYAWLRSPPHAANMFNPKFTQLGVGVAYAHGVYWWCLVLARPG